MGHDPEQQSVSGIEDRAHKGLAEIVPNGRGPIRDDIHRRPARQESVARPPEYLKARNAAGDYRPEELNKTTKLNMQCIIRTTCSGPFVAFGSGPLCRSFHSFHTFLP